MQFALPDSKIDGRLVFSIRGTNSQFVSVQLWIFSYWQLLYTKC